MDLANEIMIYFHGLWFSFEDSHNLPPILSHWCNNPDAGDFWIFNLWEVRWRQKLSFIRNEKYSRHYLSFSFLFYLLFFTLKYYCYLRKEQHMSFAVHFYFYSFSFSLSRLLFIMFLSFRVSLSILFTVSLPLSVRLLSVFFTLPFLFQFSPLTRIFFHSFLSFEDSVFSLLFRSPYFPSHLSFALNIMLSQTLYLFPTVYASHSFISSLLMSLSISPISTCFTIPLSSFPFFVTHFFVILILFFSSFDKLISLYIFSVCSLNFLSLLSLTSNYLLHTLPLSSTHQLNPYFQVHQ